MFVGGNRVRLWSSCAKQKRRAGCDVEGILWTAITFFKMVLDHGFTYMRVVTINPRLSTLNSKHFGVYQKAAV